MRLRLGSLALVVCACSGSSTPAVCPAVGAGVTSIEAASFDVSCTKDSDCFGVHVGEQCSDCTCAAINVGALGCYQEQSYAIRRESCGTSVDECVCSTRVFYCLNSVCRMYLKL